MHPGFFNDSLFFRELPPIVHRFLHFTSFLITGSGRVADGVMRTIGKVDAAYITPDSILLPVVCWIPGEWFFAVMERFVGTLIVQYNESKHKSE
jgi:hypothetical protein